MSLFSAFGTKEKNLLFQQKNYFKLGKNIKKSNIYNWEGEIEKIFPNTNCYDKRNDDLVNEDSLMPCYSLEELFDFSSLFDSIKEENIKEICSEIKNLKHLVDDQIYHKINIPYIKCSLCSKQLDTPCLCKNCKKPICYGCFEKLNLNSSGFICPFCEELLDSEDIINIPCLDTSLIFPGKNFLPLEETFQRCYMHFLYFCQNCNKILLPNSIIECEEHKDHSIIKMKDYYDKLYDIYSDKKSKMTYLFSFLSKKINQMEKISADLTEEKIKRETEFESYVEYLRNGLKQKYEKIKENLENEIKKLKEISQMILKGIESLKEKNLEGKSPLKFTLSQLNYLPLYKELNEEFKRNSVILKKDNVKEALNLFNSYPLCFMKYKPVSYDINKKIKVKIENGLISCFSNGKLCTDYFSSSKESNIMKYPIKISDTEKIDFELELSYGIVNMKIISPEPKLKLFCFDLSISVFNEKDITKKIEIAKEHEIFNSERSYFSKMIKIEKFSEILDEDRFVIFDICLKGDYEIYKNGNTCFDKEKFTQFITQI
ncbi:MAG: hypothetical protein MJ252_03245 [archaeon]|nr:hypothetical protein [archaeon]